MNKEPKLPKLLFFRKIRPKYKKALILALIISFVVAVILLLVFNKYFFKPVLENRGSVKNKPAVIVSKQERRLRFVV